MIVVADKFPGQCLCFRCVQAGWSRCKIMHHRRTVWVGVADIGLQVMFLLS